jgi:hypothetical protein
MSNVLTLAGTPLTTTRTVPTPRLATCEITESTRQLVPINNCLLALEAELRRLLALLGGDVEEWRDRVCDVAEKVGGMGDE